MTVSSLEEAFRNGEQAERARRDRFQERFPGIASVPVVSRAFRAIYCHGFSYVLVLLIAITVFTAIKVPYLKAPFTGEHSMKYNTYVEPAYYMVQKGSMLWNQKKYVSDPVHNPEGIFPRFDHLPLMEWGLFLTYKMFPDAGIELKTRIFTHLVGVLTLLYAYLFFCRYFPKGYSLLFVGLLSVNPVFSFSTYVTVLDSIALLFMFLSLRRIGVYFEHGRVASLLWAAMWFGAGNAVKYPLFLWLAPIGLLFLYFESGDPVLFLKNFTIYLSVSLLVTLAGVLITNLLIPSPASAAALAFLLVLILLLVRYLLVKHDESVNGLFRYLWANKKILGTVCAVALLAGVVLFRVLKLSDFADEFLTDSSLVANYRLYKYMLFRQFKNYMTRNLFWLGMFGAALAFLTREKPMRRVWFPFLFGSLVYWIVASKSIFFHIYYSLIIVLTLTASAAYFIYFVGSGLKSNLQKTVIYLCFFSLLLPPILDETTGRMQNYADVGDVVRYIKENTKPDEFILFEGYLTPLSIYTGRGFVMPAVLADDAIREDIRRIGFANTMSKYKVKYLFTPNDQPFYLDYAPIFETTRIKEASGTNYDRILTINKAIGISDPVISEEMREVEGIGEKYDVKEKFVFASQVGRFRFYSFQN